MINTDYPDEIVDIIVICVSYLSIIVFIFHIVTIVIKYIWKYSTIKLELKLTEIIFSKTAEVNEFSMMTCFLWFILNSSTYRWNSSNDDIVNVEVDTLSNFFYH